MKKARIIGLGVFILALILGLLGWWFWSLGSVSTAEQPILRLAVEQGGVFVKSGNGLEEQAKSGMVLSKGDIVRTAPGGRASITASGRSDLRLSENTEVEVSDVNLNWAQDFVFRFNLKTGRAWSRVLRLLDLGSTYEGQTDNVVATVRGTAFALQKTGEETQLFVDHSAVVTPILGSTMGEDVFTKDEWGSFDFEGRVMLRGDMSSSSWPERAWIADEHIADERFTTAARNTMLESLSGKKNIAMDNWAYGLSRASENWHLRFSGDKCKDLKVRYMGKQLFNVYDLTTRGKSGLAFQFLADLETDINLEDTCTQKVDYADPVGRMLLALSDVSPEDDLYKLKLKCEEMYIGLYPEHSPEAYYARGLALDARLDELERFGCRPDFPLPMESAMDAVEQGLARQDKDFESLVGAGDDVMFLLSNKTHVQHVRLETFIEKLDQCRFEDMYPPADDITATSTTSTEMETPTSTTDVDVNDGDAQNNSPDNNQTEPPVVPDVKPDTNQIQPGALDLQRIQLFAQTNPVNVGGTTNLYVKGIKKDGSEVDVTSRASFEQVGDLGVITGARYLANKSGSVTLTAKVNDNGQVFTAQVSLRITEPLVLSYLEINRNGSNQVYQGDTRQLSVIAHYANGEVKTVTSYSTYFTSNSQIGTMSGSLFRAGANSVGPVTVTVQYTEDGVMKQGEINFEVVYDTANRITP